MMVSTILGTLLLPFLFSLFYFSNSRQRRSPMFVCVVLSVMAALVQFANEIAFEALGISLRSHERLVTQLLSSSKSCTAPRT
jgi:hypothetical protein